MPELSRIPRPRGPKAFTLIELLVTITVIAILVAMLVPTVLQAVEEAERVACMSNLHQGTVAMAVYADYNGGFLPPTQIGGFRGAWAYLISEHMGKNGDTDGGTRRPVQGTGEGFGNHYMRCPSQELELPRTPHPVFIFGSTYGAHWGQGEDDTPDRAPMESVQSDMLAKLEDVFVIADSNGDFLTPTEPNWIKDPPPLIEGDVGISWWAVGYPSFDEWVHNDTYNFGYMDGSVRNIPRQWFVDNPGFVPGTIPQSPP